MMPAPPERYIRKKTWESYFAYLDIRPSLPSTEISNAVCPRQDDMPRLRRLRAVTGKSSKVDAPLPFLPVEFKFAKFDVGRQTSSNVFNMSCQTDSGNGGPLNIGVGTVSIACLTPQI